METIRFNNGNEMSKFGFGVYQIKPEETKDSVTLAIKNGYRMFDTAALYMNKTQLGEAINESGIAREDFFVTTKLWVQDNGYDNTKKAVKNSLERLGFDYIDLYLIHQPIGDVHGSWRVMEELYEQGVIRNIGVSNFTSSRLIDLITFNKVTPVLNQIEVNVFHQQQDAVNYNSQHDVVTQAWSPLGAGQNDIFTNETLGQIAKKYNKSVSQVVLRWLLQRDIAVIPRSISEEHIKENIEMFDFELSEEDMTKIQTLDTGKSLFFDNTTPYIVEQASKVVLDI